MRKHTFLLSLCLVMALFFTSTTAFAAENDSELVLQSNEKIIYQDDEVTVVESSAVNTAAATRSNNYGNVWLNSSGSGSFSVYCTKSGSIGVTFKSESTSSSSWAVMSLYNPEGICLADSVYVSPSSGDGEGVQFKIYASSAGTYTVSYVSYNTVGTRLMCWMY